MNDLKELLGGITSLASGESSLNVEVSIETRSIMYLCVGLMAAGIICITLSKSL